jgi:soluble lytic murein transglycosylase
MVRIQGLSRLKVIASFAFLCIRAASAMAVPSPEDLSGASDEDRVQILCALGLHQEAERTLRQAIDGGQTWARGALLSLFLNQDRYEEAGSFVSSWGGADSVLSEEALFLAGRVREGERKWLEAAKLFAASTSREPLLADYAAYRAGLAFEKAGDGKEALSYCESSGGTARSAELSAQAHWKAASLSWQQGDPERALANLERIPARSIIARTDLLDLEAKIYRMLEDTVREARVLRELFDRAPSSEAAVAAIRRLSELEEPTVRDRIAFAESALKNRHPSLAEEQSLLALAALQTSPNPVLEGKARLHYGNALLSRRLFTKARQELDRIPTGADSGDRAEAFLARARCLWRLGQLDAALAEYDEIADGPFPSAQRADAAWEAAREAKDNGRWREAALRLGEFQRLFPEHKYADAALWHRGRALLEVGETKEAINTLQLLRESYPSTNFFEEATYWIAQTERGSGRETEACAEFSRLLNERPDSYWATRARDVLGERPCGDAPPALPSEAEDLFEWLSPESPADSSGAPALSARVHVEASERFRRARTLALAGLRGEAESELEGLAASLARDDASLVALAEAAWRVGVPRASMRTILELKKRNGRAVLAGMPARLARLLYPVEHVDAVLRWSVEYGVDPFFVYAVMREESWFDPEAISWAGAHGLLQIMPSTGRDLARRVGLLRFQQSDLFDPNVNIRLGTFYLGSLLEELDSEPLIALSAYNAGKFNALRWKKGIDGAFDADRYVAGITYPETYHYVQRVTRSWTIYRHLYGGLVARWQEYRELQRE